MLFSVNKFLLAKYLSNINEKTYIYMALVELSYVGDLRTYIKYEKSDKIKEMIEGSFDQYEKIYGNMFEETKNMSRNHLISTIEQNNPSFVRTVRIASMKRNGFVEFSRRDVECQLKRLNFKVSVVSAFSALLTTPFIKMLKYNREKYRKSLTKEKM